MTSPTMELPIVAQPRQATPTPELPADLSEAITEGFCLVIVVVFVVGLLAYALARSCGWQS